MERLTDQTCEPCRSGSAPMSQRDIERLKSQLPDWDLLEIDGVVRLSQSFRFRNFAEALAFTNRVGALAEAEGHHPALLTEWGQVTVQWWTHKIGGLHRNDFILAAKTEALAN